ncbi:MAG TPA: NAD(P)/FAD-dependent oxidoreductase [Sporichthya sp.]|nr:NAD(P)/FAD-dependent oxidoreductase [Sporichthya sp.]
MTQPQVDAVVVGAGFAGLRSIHELRRLGLSMRVFEAGSDVGGTWYWNRYPGARTDTESWGYCFFFDRELGLEWEWPERFPGWADVLKYMQHVADRYDMRKEITFNARVNGAFWDEDSSTWTVTTEAGEKVTCRWLITGLGWLGVAYKPNLPGLDEFRGDWYQTSNWPHEDVDLAGKRVAVIGTGATGIQVIQTIAPVVEHLTVFQRTPNYVMPGRNHALSEEQRAALKADYDAITAQTFNHVFAFPMDPANQLGSEVSDEELTTIFERGWEDGGFRYIFTTVDDMLVDQRVNDIAAEFVRKKIRAIVKDPATAELLCPTTHPIGGKRPPLGNFYYETFNRPNVSLVNVRPDPIAAITPTGVRLTSGAEYDVDVIIFATGFDAMTGPLEKMNVHGVGGRTLKDEWAEGCNLHLGISQPGFPNLFSVLGPQGPFASHPPVIEKQVEFIGKVLEHAIAQGAERVEATPEAGAAWTAMCDLILNMTLVPKGIEDRPWFLGANVPGKKPTTLCYLGGMAGYCAELDKETGGGFPGYEMSKAPVPA